MSTTDQAETTLATELIADKRYELTEEQLDIAYRQAVYHYQTGHIDQACTLFDALVNFDVLDKRVWFGLGACLQSRAEYKEAMAAYMAASALDDNDPKPWLQSAECHVALVAGQAVYENLVEAEQRLPNEPQARALTAAHIKRIAVLLAALPAAPVATDTIH